MLYNETEEPKRPWIKTDKNFFHLVTQHAVLKFSLLRVSLRTTNFSRIQNTSQKPKTPRRIQNTYQKPKALPRIQKHVPESKTRPRNQKHFPESKTLPRNQKHFPESKTRLIIKKHLLESTKSTKEYQQIIRFLIHSFILSHTFWFAMARKRDGMPFPRVPSIELLIQNPFSRPKFSLNPAISIFGIPHPMHSTTYPSPKSTFNTYYTLKAKLWLRGGIGGRLPSNLDWSHIGNPVFWTFPFLTLPKIIRMDTLQVSLFVLTAVNLIFTVKYNNCSSLPSQWAGFY